MFDFFTFSFYLVLLGSLILLTLNSVKVNSKEITFLKQSSLGGFQYIALLLISFVVGFRYNVGVDWEGYTNDFDTFVKFPNLAYSDQYFEYAYFVINKIIANSGLSYEWMFFTVAFISWFFVFKSVPKLLLPLFLTFIFFDEVFFSSMNGVRQFAAISVWLFASKFIISKDLKKYLFFIVLASLFHTSALILIPFYFIPYHKLNKRSPWLILFILTFLIGASPIFLDLSKKAVLFIGDKVDFIGTYTRYSDSEHFSINQETQTGLGFTFKILVNLFIILISGRVLEKYPETKTYFVLFFIGAILFNLTYNIQILGRINSYFLIFRPFILAVAVYYFWAHRKYRIFVIGFVALYFLIFLSAIYNSSNMSSPFQFSPIFRNIL